MAESRSQRARKPAGRKPAALAAVAAVAAGAGQPQAIPFDHERHLFYWFTQVIGRRDRHLNQALRPYGVRVPEWRVLGLLHSRRGLSMSEVADAAAIDPTTLSRTVAQLVEEGLVVRLSPVGDKRVTRLALTAAGLRLVERVLPIVFRLNEIAFAGLPAGVVELMQWAFGRMRNNLDANLADVPARDTARN
ncbi:MAG: MarR family transcriptional regulator [Alphaproteobacteria bacterium]